MVNFGPLAAETGSLVWAIPANFNGFPAMASLMQRRRSMEAHQTLHYVWPSPGLVHYIYIIYIYFPRLLHRNGILPGICVQVLCCPKLAALLHGTRVVGVSQTLRCWAKDATYTRQGGHHVGHWPTL